MFLILIAFNLLCGTWKSVNGIRYYLEMYDEGDFGCKIDATARIQIALVADITGTNWQNIRTAFSERSTQVVNAVNAVHKNTEFAITTHANWERSAWGWKHREPEGCYTRDLSFTTNVSAIAEVTKNLKEKGGGPYQDVQDENALPAIAFAIADNKLGWIREDIDEQGRNVHRMIFLFTDAYSKFDELWVPGNRTKFKGDGTDTCLNSRPAGRQQIGEMLQKHGALLIGAYLTGDHSVARRYKEFFEEFKIPHIYRGFTSYQLANEMGSYLATTVRRHLACIYDDPPAYNTLGL